MIAIQKINSKEYQLILGASISAKMLSNEVVAYLYWQHGVPKDVTKKAITLLLSRQHDLAGIDVGFNVTTKKHTTPLFIA